MGESPTLTYSPNSKGCSAKVRLMGLSVCPSICLSIHREIENFDLQPKLKRMFRKGPFDGSVCPSVCPSIRLSFHGESQTLTCKLKRKFRKGQLDARKRYRVIPKMTHFVCPSVGPSVGTSVHLSIRRHVRLSVLLLPNHTLQ